MATAFSDGARSGSSVRAAQAWMLAGVGLTLLAFGLPWRSATPGYVTTGRLFLAAAAIAGGLLVTSVLKRRPSGLLAAIAVAGPVAAVAVVARTGGFASISAQALLTSVGASLAFLVGQRHVRRSAASRG